MLIASRGFASGREVLPQQRPTVKRERPPYLPSPHGKPGACVLTSHQTSDAGQVQEGRRGRGDCVRGHEVQLARLPNADV